MDQLNHLLNKIKTLSPDSLAQLNSFANFLHWQEQSAAKQANQVTWTFDFIENFAAAEKIPKNKQLGSEIKIGVTTSDGVEKPALFAHPPVQGRSVIEYYVPVPHDVEELKLKFAIGIRDGAKLSGSNLVAFSILMNGYRIWGTQTNVRRWQGYEIDLAAHIGDVNQIAFTTEALGNHQWTWAAWGAPVITGARTG